jgi:hypothetical protein
MYKIIIATFISLSLVLGSVLSDAVATMNAGNWKKITTNLTKEMLCQGASYFPSFASDLGYDPKTQKIFFLGGGHGRTWNFIIYDIATNTFEDVWSGSLTLPLSCMASSTADSACPDHEYDCIAMDTDSSIFYFLSRKGEGGTGPIGASMFRYDINASTWSVHPEMIATGIRLDVGMGVEYFTPLKKFVVYSARRGRPGLQIFDHQGRWTKLGGYVTGHYPNFVLYNTHNKKIYFGGSNSGGTSWEELDTNLNITAIPNSPVSGESSSENLMHDAATGDILLLKEAGSLYACNVYGTKSWRTVDNSPPPMAGGKDVLSCDLTDYYANFFIASETNGNNAEVWLYKHSNDVPPVLEEKAIKHAEKNPMTISPNPFSGTARITIGTSLNADNYSLKIFDINGKRVKDLTSGIPNSSFVIRNSFSFYLQAEGLSAGLYIVRLSYGKKVFEKKLFHIN